MASPLVARPSKPKHKRPPKGGVVWPKIGPMVFLEPVGQAVNLLLNNAIKLTETKGSAALTTTTFPAELVTAARGMFPSGKVYNFEIHASGTIAATAGGVVNTRASWDPSVTTFAEWTALAALFDECNSNSIHIDITSAFGPTSTNIVVQIMIAPDRDGVSGPTPAYTAIQRLAESEPFHVYNMGSPTSPGVFSKTHHIRRNRPWAVTSAPGGASGTPSGLIGQYSIASNIVTTPTNNVLFWALKHNVALRNRA